MCHLVTTSEIETKFNRESTDKKKYIDLTSEISINNKDYGQLSDCRFIVYLPIPKY